MLPGDRAPGRRRPPRARTPDHRRRRARLPERCAARASAGRGGGDLRARTDTSIRPERFARLVTLASILIKAGREGGAQPGGLGRVAIAEVRERLQLSDEELREDVNVLNVVNFGGGSYVLYAEIKEEEGEIEVDPEPYSDNFDRPARLLPVEAKALVAAIDLIGEHIPEGSLTSAGRRSSRRSARTRWSRACRSPTRAGTTRAWHASSPARSSNGG